MSDGDFTKGQEAIIKDMIENSISTFRTEMDSTVADRSKEIAKKEIDEFEKGRVPLWKFWKSPTATGVFVTCLVAVIAIIYDRSYGQRFLDGVLHEVIGTQKYVSDELAREGSELNRGINGLVEGQIDYSDPFSSFNQAVESAANSYINKFDAQDHPIPKVVRQITGRRPILVFQGQDIFGQADEVTIEFPGCDEFSEYLEIYNQENRDFSPPFFDCNLRGFVQDAKSLNIPFFSSFWARSGAPGHDVHVILSINRVPSNYQNADTYISPHIESIHGLNVSYLRASDSIGAPEEIDLSNHVRRLEGNFFYLELSEHVREKYAYDPSLNTEQTFLHSVQINEDPSAFSDIGEIVGVQALIFINRKPRYVEN